MRKLILLSTACLLIAVGTQSCSEESVAISQNYENQLKADDDFWDKVKGFLKKKLKLRIDFGHSIPVPNSPTGETWDCVFKSLCIIEVEGELGINDGRPAAIGTLNQSGSLIFTFDKSTLTNDDLNYHFDQNEFHIIDPVVIPNLGITNSDNDYAIAAGIYPVVYEDAEIIAVTF